MIDLAIVAAVAIGLFSAGLYVGTKTERAYQERNRYNRSRAYCSTHSNNGVHITTTWDYKDV